MANKALSPFEQWHSALKLYGGFPAKGTLSGALCVIEQLKERFDLNIDSHTAKGGSQVRGAGGDAVRKILQKFGETRPFVSEGGRTNRGLRGDIEKMLSAIKLEKLEALAPAEKVRALERFQKVLVEKVREFHNQQRLKMNYDFTKTTRQSILELLAVARETGKEGPVAQYLIGAKLQLRFPDVSVSNESYSTADQQLNRPGDFLIGNTAFHVTVAPMPAVYEKCTRNILDGQRVYLLVPDRLLEGAKQNAEVAAPGRVAVEAIESFIAQNIDELSKFSKDKVADEFKRLLEMYNQRVDSAEIDKSMLVEIPQSLSR
ncbi:MAG: DUF4928 family protein [Candidatus Omnitrophota bacterium]